MYWIPACQTEILRLQRGSRSSQLCSVVSLWVLLVARMVLRELRRDIPGGCVQGAMVRDWLTSDICSLAVDASPQFLGHGKEIDGAQAASALGCLLSWAGSELL